MVEMLVDRPGERNMISAAGGPRILIASSTAMPQSDF
jgi:hypothetical protein